MPAVHVPAELRDLTGGRAMVDVDARTLGEVIDGLETRYPGLRTRLVTDGHLRPGLRALVAGAPAKGDLRGPVGATDEIFFLRQIGGGA